MHGFPNTKCRINGCNNPVWPSRTKGLCNCHYQRNKRGRMNPDDGSLLPLLNKMNVCEHCGEQYELKPKEYNARWCPDCRLNEKNEIRNNLNTGVYICRATVKKRNENERIMLSIQRKFEQDAEKQDRYIKQVVHWLEKSSASLADKSQIIRMHKQGVSLNEIGKRVGMSKEGVRQVILKYTC